MINLMKAHFETEENYQKYLSEWHETTLLGTISENPGKSRLERFQLTVDKYEYGQHWTDGTYGSRRGRSFGSYRGRGGSTSQRYGGTQRTGFQQKICHVCDKPSCWSTKHRWRSKGIAPSLAKLFVFVDGSFANNKDFSSQIGYLIILANEMDFIDEFTIEGNLIHYSSTKSKRVTRSVLASEIYGMVGGVDMAISINTTIKMITDQLEFSHIPIIVCTDSYSLYECLVKLGTTKEKRLMIDIMALRQSYERREITEIRWIDGKDNPADAMTKSAPNSALENFLTTNCLRVRVEGWVQRKGMEE